MPDLFSVPAMFIMLRESIEACVVVALLLNMCNRLKLQRMRKQVWLGAGSGILVSVGLGIAFAVAFYITKSKVMGGAAKAIFKGYINLVAALLITLLAFAMLRFMNYERKWAAKLEDAASKIDVGRGNQWSIFLLAFTAVFREGVESVIFLAGVSTTTSWTAIPLAGIVGVALGVAVGFALYYTGKQIKDIAWFFVLSCAFLFFIAAGLVSLALTAWQSVGWFGTWEPATDRPWLNRAAWDWSACCSTSNQFFALMTALFGYQARPTPLSLFGYFGYWAIVLFDIGVKQCRGTLTDAAKGKELKGAVPAGALSAGGAGEEPSTTPTEPPALLGDLHVPACGHAPVVKAGGDVESQKCGGAAGGKRK
jgi:high-affinity iron transporter